jgi:hypothetical protein
MKNETTKKHAAASKHLMEAMYSSETLVTQYQIARPYIPDNSTSHCRVHKYPPLGIILSQMNPVNIVIPVCSRYHEQQHALKACYFRNKDL